jgi:hypothetical protein
MTGLSIVADPAIIAALITSIFGASLSTYTYFLNKRKSEQDARRDYEYEARKRLYQECEPLLFKLVETSETALTHIKDMAKRAKGENEIMFSDEYFLKTTVYYLLLPCAVLRQISRRLTLVDLQLDNSIHSQYILAKAIYHSFTHDMQIAKLANSTYTPYVQKWREKRIENPRVFRRQGFPLGRLDNALDIFINEEYTKEGTKSYSFMTFGEFEEKFNAIKEDDVNSILGTSKDMFFQFHPATRPILWNILIIQAALYDGILKLSLNRNMTPTQIIEYIFSSSQQMKNDLNCCVDKDIFQEPFEVATAYMHDYIKKPLESLDIPANRNKSI